MSAVRKLDLTRRLAPAAEILLNVLEDEALNDNAFRHLGNALHEMADAAEDDDLGLQWATPEQRVEALPDRIAPENAAAPAFDPHRCTPYVRSIYAAELEAIHTAAPGTHKRQLQRCAYTLARIVGGGALPGEHVRESLAAAAVGLQPSDVTAIIETAFRKGLANPRNLPTEDLAT
jgi:hypothetical protein